MYMVPLMFMGMFMHVHACSCMLNSGCLPISIVSLSTGAHINKMMEAMFIKIYMYILVC